MSVSFWATSFILSFLILHRHICVKSFCSNVSRGAVKGEMRGKWVLWLAFNDFISSSFQCPFQHSCYISYLPITPCTDELYDYVYVLDGSQVQFISASNRLISYSLSIIALFLRIASGSSHPDKPACINKISLNAAVTNPFYVVVISYSCKHPPIS